MQNKLFCILISLALAGCGLGYDHAAFFNKEEEKRALSKEFGSILDRTDKDMIVIAPKQYVLNVFKRMADQHNQLYELTWDRRSALVQYTADKLYKILVHPGNTTGVNESSINAFEVSSVIEFIDPKVISPKFKQQLVEAFYEEQKHHDPHEHINALRITKGHSAHIKSRIDEFFKKLYPTAKINTDTIHGKVYTVVSVRREEDATIESFDNIYYLVKDFGQNQSEIQLHFANFSRNTINKVFDVVSKDKSLQLLDAIIMKLGL